MTNDGNANQNPWPGKPQQPYAQPPHGQPMPPQQPYGGQQQGQQPYGQPAPQGYGEPVGGQQPYGQQPYGSAPGSYGAPRPKRSLREPLVGGIAVVGVVLLFAVLGVLRSLIYGIGGDVGYVGQSFGSALVPVVFAGLAFVSAGFLSPIESAVTRPAFLKSAAIAIGIGAAGLFVVPLLLIMPAGPDVQVFVYMLLGTIINAVQYGAVFIAAILIDRIGRRSA